MEHLLSQIKDMSATQPDEIIRKCRQLYKMAKKQGNQYYMAEALFQMSLVYWKLGCIEKTLSSSMKASKYARAHLNPETYARIKNMLGILSELDQNDTLALEYYLEGYEVATQYKLNSIAAHFITNIGSLYQNLNHQERAIRYFSKAERMNLSEKVDLQEYYRKKVNISVNFAISYFYQEEYSIAMKYIERAFASYEKMEEKDLEFILECMKCRILWRKGETEAAKHKVSHLVYLFLNEEQSIDYPQDIGELFAFLMEAEEFQSVDVVLAIFEAYVENQGITSLLIRALEMRILYYEKIGDHQAYQEKCIAYFELKQKHAKETNQKRFKSLEISMALRKKEQKVRESEKMNADLQRKSEEDPLTHLGNRYRLEGFYKKLVKGNQANRDSMRLAVGIIDVDFFKQYNDFYGHVKGDECLRLVASVIIQAIHESHGICVRYGGDEFVLLLPNTDETILTGIADSIMKQVRKLRIEHEKSLVSPVLTVSQGYYLGTIQSKHQLSDYISQADMSLYLVKKQSRDGYHIRKQKDS